MCSTWHSLHHNCNMQEINTVIFLQLENYSTVKFLSVKSQMKQQGSKTIAMINETLQPMNKCCRTLSARIILLWRNSSAKDSSRQTNTNAKLYANQRNPSSQRKTSPFQTPETTKRDLRAYVMPESSLKLQAVTLF